MNGYFNSALDSQTSAQNSNLLFSATNGEYMGSMFNTILDESPTTAYMGYMDLQDAKDQYTTTSEVLDPEAANEKYGIKGHLKFDSPIPEKAAQLMNQRKYGEMYRAQVLEQGTTAQAIGGFGVGLAATLVDPLNIAAMFIPVVGEARVGKFVSNPVARRLLTGAIDGGITIGGLQGLTAGLLTEYQADYTMASALRDTAMGAVLGGVLHAGAGAIGDIRLKQSLKNTLPTAVPEETFNRLMSYAKSVEKGPGEEVFQCHECMQELVKNLKNEPEEVLKDLRIYEWDELAWDKVAQKIKDSGINFDNNEIQALLNDISDGTLNGHSWAEYRGEVIDPYLSDLGVPQKDINDLSKFLGKIYEDSGISPRTYGNGIAIVRDPQQVTAGPVQNVLLRVEPETVSKLQAHAAADLNSGKPVSSPENLVGFDKNLIKAEAESRAGVAPDANPVIDPIAPSSSGEKPAFYNPDFKFSQDVKAFKTRQFKEKPITEEVTPGTKPKERRDFDQYNELQTLRTQYDDGEITPSDFVFELKSKLLSQEYDGDEAILRAIEKYEKEAEQDLKDWGMLENEASKEIPNIVKELEKFLDKKQDFVSSKIYTGNIESAKNILDKYPEPDKLPDDFKKTLDNFFLESFRLFMGKPGEAKLENIHAEYLDIIDPQTEAYVREAGTSLKAEDFGKDAGDWLETTWQDMMDELDLTNIPDQGEQLDFKVLRDISNRKKILNSLSAANMDPEWYTENYLNFVEDYKKKTTSLSKTLKKKLGREPSENEVKSAVEDAFINKPSNPGRILGDLIVDLWSRQEYARVLSEADSSYKIPKAIQNSEKISMSNFADIYIKFHEVVYDVNFAEATDKSHLAVNTLSLKSALQKAGQAKDAIAKIEKDLSDYLNQENKPVDEVYQKARDFLKSWIKKYEKTAESPGKIEKVKKKRIYPPKGYSLVKPEIRSREVKVTPNVMGMATQMFGESEKFRSVVFNDSKLDFEHLFQPRGLITYEQTQQFIANNHVLYGAHSGEFNRVEGKTIIDEEFVRNVWDFLLSLGIKESDIDSEILKSNYKKNGNPLGGIQSTMLPLKGNLSDYILTFSSGPKKLKKPEERALFNIGFDFGGVTTVPIKYKDIPLNDQFDPRVFRVAVTERILTVDEYFLLQRFVTKDKMPMDVALDRVKNTSKVQLENIITKSKKVQNEYNDFRKEVFKDLATKLIIANLPVEDLHLDNVGLKIPKLGFDEPRDVLVMDKGGAIGRTPEEIYDMTVSRVDDPEGSLMDPETKNKIIDEAVKSRMMADYKNRLKDEENAALRRKLSELEEKLKTKSNEKTWWQPGDNVPSEVKADEIISQVKLSTPEDLAQDIQKITSDTQDFINTFKNEMSDADLEKLKQFDEAAKQAETAKQGFIQAAICVIRNLL